MRPKMILTMGQVPRSPLIGMWLIVLGRNWPVTEEGAFPVPKLCQNPMFFMSLGLALSEKQTPQITENTEKSK
jgi:hypothetical protein